MLFANEKILRWLTFLILAGIIFPIGALAASGNHTSAEIYYNEACQACVEYVHETLPADLRDNGVNSITEKDYVNEKKYRIELNARAEELEIPYELQGHIMTYVGDDIILAGHIPTHIVKSLLASVNQDRFEKIIVFQDKMHGDITNYKIWAFKGDIKEYDIDTPVEEYLGWLGENPDLAPSDSLSEGPLLSLVLLTGLVDGINPCAIAVLLFFIAFLFTLKRTKGNIIRMGIVYMLAIYLAYLLIGIGLLQAIVITGIPHLMAKIGAGLVIGLGIINLVGVLFPKFPIRLRIPHFSKETLEEWMHKATLPAAFVLGFLVGLCTFPCSGGAYVAIVSLLSAQVTYFKGLGYLLLYNIMFIVPLMIILAGTGNAKVTAKITEWEKSKKKKLRILMSLFMIALGVGIIVWIMVA